ncbi:hypothetical protein M501DRAFT_926540 [Patellaria atrata CBS 101060]|uniref:DDRGK domain-containing protein n=1 Tax=Patellaria atrata CBS 101060 TaxID=1346257 RepID=A0A9P4VTW1_9PEZI|nr:hypothetical protein M501DRAFT_926540 [Patellaria atrata CBS 101060]
MPNLIVRILNTLLPFTDPDTPLSQDIVHTLAICILLYFAPHILDQRVQNHQRQHQEQLERQVDNIQPDTGDIARAGAIDLDADVPLENADPQLEEDQLEAPGFQGNALPDQGVQDHAAPDINPRATRVVGAKKAKSLARRDQRRAYHEFQRAQGERQRAADAEGAEEREAALLEEKRRRALIEMEIEEKQRVEREAKKEKERKEKQEELTAQRECLRLVRDRLEKAGSVDLTSVAKSLRRPVEWAEGLVRAGGILEKSKKSGNIVIAMLTGESWVVLIDQDMMDEVYRNALNPRPNDDGKVTMEQLGRIIEDKVRGRALAVR